jgi:hypothetical protein
MMRMVRRSLRQWKREFLAFWGRFTAFHRIVIGILLAMVLVFAARARLLDPLDHDLAALYKELADNGIPVQVPLAETDETILEEVLRAENLERSLENLGAQLDQAEDATQYRLGASKADADSALLGLAGRHGLRVLKNLTADAPTDGPVPAAASAYELAGRFAAIHGFLEAVSREPFLWELREVSIGLQDEAEAFGGGAAPLLVLRFKLVQHLYRGAHT